MNNSARIKLKLTEMVGKQTPCQTQKGKRGIYGILTPTVQIQVTETKERNI